MRYSSRPSYKNALTIMALTTLAMISFTEAGSRATVGTEIVDEISASDPGWEPMNVTENPFRDYSND